MPSEKKVGVSFLGSWNASASATVTVKYVAQKFLFYDRVSKSLEEERALLSAKAAWHVTQELTPGELLHNKVVDVNCHRQRDHSSPLVVTLHYPGGADSMLKLASLFTCDGHGTDEKTISSDEKLAKTVAQEAAMGGF